MENKKYCLVILVIMLVFGMTFVGCDFDPNNENGSLSKTEWRFKNSSTYTIVVENIGAAGNSFNPTNFELAPDSQQIIKAENEILIFLYNWSRKDTGDQTGVYLDQSTERTETFRNN